MKTLKERNEFVSLWVCAVSFVLVQRTCHHEGLDGQSPDTRFRFLLGEDVQQRHFQGVYLVENMDLFSNYCYYWCHYFLVLNPSDGVKTGGEAEATVNHCLT